VVRNSEGRDLTFTVREDADVTLGLQPATLDDYRPVLDAVTINYSEGADGALTAASIDAHRGRRHDRWGILIGTQSYADPALSRLTTPSADAQLVYESLVNRYAMDPEWALRLIDRNRNDVTSEIEQRLASVAANHQVVLYIAGHAYVGPDGKAYLALKDFQFADMPGTGLSLDWLVAQLEACPSTDKLLLLDVVHDGSGTDVAQQPSAPDLLYKLTTPVRRTDIIASCDAGQRGRLLASGRQSAFAHYVAAGLSGPADADKDLHITGGELFNYLRAELANAPLSGGHKQTPFRLAPSGQ
jgi:hypothetical protein